MQPYLWMRGLKTNSLNNPMKLQHEKTRKEDGRHCVHPNNGEKIRNTENIREAYIRNFVFFQEYLTLHSLLYLISG